METLLQRSSRIIDNNERVDPAVRNPTDMQLSELDSGLAMIAGFSHILALRTDDGLALFDTSGARFAQAMRDSLRGWSQAPVDSVVYTHGHADHVGGMQVFIEEAAGAGRRRPRIVGHENIAPRFARYQQTLGYNAIINGRQFSSARAVSDTDFVQIKAQPGRFGPEHWHAPDTCFADRLGLQVGGTDIQLFHARGETDDHAWAWIPRHRAIMAGDFLIWAFPNAGNPQKVQRYPLEWAQALRTMAALRPEFLLPAHGLPIVGEQRIARVLDDIATVLERLVRQSLELMNQGARLDRLIHEVHLPPELIDRPYLQPIYDEPEFVVRNIWRQYGGWHDGNPANLKPAPEAALADEIARLAGGAARLAARASELADSGEWRLACHLVEMAGLAAPKDPGVHGLRAQIYERRRDQELSLMARGLFGSAAEASRVVGGNATPD